jgi:hypothetical protein
MLHSNLATSPVTPKNVIGLSVLFLILAVIFGLFNGHKMKTLRTNAANARAARDAAEHRREGRSQNLGASETTSAGGEEKIAAAENKAAKAEADLAQLQKEKADLQTKLDTNQNEIVSLQKRVEEMQKTAKPVGSPAVTAAPTAELQKQLDDARHQLDSAEKEKAFLSQKLQAAQGRSSPLQEEKKRRETSPRKPGVHGTVLAVNQAYNFAVLNLGARQGVEPNSEMLVLREGTLICKIRISSVEPATAIGDIVSNSLGRGVQVQPGDTVVYAGTNL